MRDTATRGTMLFATRSEAKVRELKPIMRELSYEVVSLRDAGIPEHANEVGIEVFETFEENALAKAHWFARLSNGMPVLADDSGLEVGVLGGRPGVRSKRWSGRSDLEGQALDDANNAHLVAALNDIRASAMSSPMPSEPTALTFASEYVCAAACVWSGGERVVRGVTAGMIVTEPRGDGGFGYDPYFLSDDLGATFGEVDGAAKGRISHRGRAFRALAVQLSRAGL